jgi:molecular chaperone DnaJ
MGGKRDYYEVLGVPREANGDEVKRAYRKLAVKLHPDRNPDDHTAEDAFKEASEAYAVLSDQERRRRYDRLGHGAFGDARGSGFPPPDLGSIGEVLEGLFGEVFGRRGESALPRDLRYELAVTFEEAALGAERVIRYERQELCRRCEGQRHEPDAGDHACAACKGRGEVRFQRGFFAAARACSACEGTGVRIEARCVGCHGRGTVARSRELSVRVPAGVADGAVRSVRGAGDESAAGKGDLHVHIRVTPHSLFTRDGADVLCDVPVSFPEAALGAEIEVPTVGGKVTMRLPAGTQSGRVFRLRGKGLPVFGGAGKGDELVRVIVEVPEKLSERQRDLVAALAKELDVDVYPRRRTFLEKLKDLLE